MTSAGGVEEDIIKCIAPTFLGDFSLRGRDLRQKGLNRIGNMVVPNENYCLFEDWIQPVLDDMYREQVEEVFLSFSFPFLFSLVFRVGHSSLMRNMCVMLGERRTRYLVQSSTAFPPSCSSCFTGCDLESIEDDPPIRKSDRQ